MTMTPLTLLRTLIWDKDAVVWTNDELDYFLTDLGNDVYQTAAHMLKLTMADPNRAQAYRLGGISKTLQDLTYAIKYYESMASTGQSMSSTTLKRSYTNETS